MSVVSAGRFQVISESAPNASRLAAVECPRRRSARDEPEHDAGDDRPDRLDAAQEADIGIRSQKRAKREEHEEHQEHPLRDARDEDDRVRAAQSRNAQARR